MRRILAEMPSRSYDVLVGRDCLEGLGAALGRRCPGGKTVVCCDENVAPCIWSRSAPVCGRPATGCRTS